MRSSRFFRAAFFIGLLACCVMLFASAFIKKPTTSVLEVAGAVYGSSDTAAVFLSTDNLGLGNVSHAQALESSKDNYLLTTPQYVLSYNSSKGGPNWVSWTLVAKDVGKTVRQNDFHPESKLPKSFAIIKPSEYAKTGYDKGHMCDSDDRTDNVADNQATFSMANMLPQVPNLNRGTWKQFETYSRKLAKEGATLDIVAGCYGSIGHIGLHKRVNVPARCWKVVQADSKDKIEVIAVDMPNTEGVSKNDWTAYKVTVKEVEDKTGYHFTTRNH